MDVKTQKVYEKMLSWVRRWEDFTHSVPGCTSQRRVKGSPYLTEDSFKRCILVGGSERENEGYVLQQPALGIAHGVESVGGVIIRCKVLQDVGSRSGSTRRASPFIQWTVFGYQWDTSAFEWMPIRVRWLWKGILLPLTLCAWQTLEN